MKDDKVIFLFRLLKFALPILIILGVINFLLPTFPNNLKYKKQLILNEPNIIFLGSSHTYFGVNTDMIEGAANLAYASQSLDFDAFIIEDNQQSLNQCKYIFIEVSYHSLPYLLKNSKGGIEISQYRHFWNYNEPTGAGVLKDHIVLFSYGIKNAVKIFVKNLLLRKSLLNTGETGWTPRKGKKDLVETGKIDSKGHNKLYLKDEKKGYEVLDFNIRNIEKIISICKKKQITAILFSTPLTKYYLEHLDEKYFNKYLKVCKTIASQNEISFFDLSNTAMINLEEEHFQDSDHLTPQGAKIFTQYLIDNIIDK